MSSPPWKHESWGINVLPSHWGTSLSICVFLSEYLRVCVFLWVWLCVWEYIYINTDVCVPLCICLIFWVSVWQSLDLHPSCHPHPQISAVPSALLRAPCVCCSYILRDLTDTPSRHCAHRTCCPKMIPLLVHTMTRRQ